MQEGKSYLRDTDDFLSKIKQLGPIPEGAILVTADVTGLYPSIPHEGGINALKETLSKRSDLKVPAQVLVDMADQYIIVQGLVIFFWKYPKTMRMAETIRLKSNTGNLPYS